jgi:hypothetical protein
MTKKDKKKDIWYNYIRCDQTVIDRNLYFIYHVFPNCQVLMCAGNEILIESKDKEEVDKLSKIINIANGIELTDLSLLASFGMEFPCQGNCQHHGISTVLVEIWLPTSPFHKTRYWYCEEAIKTDLNNGIRLIGVYSGQEIEL